MKSKGLYTGVLISLLLLVLFSLGGGLWGAQSTIGHWTGDLFRGICHQNPLRSFHVEGVQMAVNSRCFGVFVGLLTGWCAIPVFIRLGLKKNRLLWYLLLALMIQIIDFSGNLIQLWENSNESRVLLGWFLGFTAAASVHDLFSDNNSIIQHDE